MQNPPLFLPLPTPDEMGRWDSSAGSLYGIPALLLMENAAQASYAVLADCVALEDPRKALVFAGKGNNGGDGVALARILHDEGHNVRVLLTVPPEELPSPAKEHAAMAVALGIAFHFPDENGKPPDIDAVLAAFGEPADASACRFEPDIVIDALTGTGIRGNLRDRELGLVRRINSFRGKAFILSLDIPSGLSGLSGKAMPEAVRADVTVCFEAGKPGLFMPGAREHTGELYIRRVGIPRELRKRMPASWRLIHPQKGAWANPSPFSHKGSAGKVLIVGGSEGMAGAPVLSALGSLRAGAGLVHVAMPGALEPAARALWPEALVAPVGSGARWQEEDGPLLVDMIGRIRPGCIVMGPGMGRDAAVGEVLRSVLSMQGKPPVLLDADALYFLRLPESDASDEGFSSFRDTRPPLVSLLGARAILTPHPGEMARMLPRSFFLEMGCQPAECEDLAARIKAVQANRPEVLQYFTGACPAALVLKGPGSLVGRHGDPVSLSPFSVGALGIGGAGDVLAGVCASLVALGMDSLKAACLAVWLHGRAGELLAEKSARGHLAREIANAVPLAWEELCLD